jgi:hypothetical protein
MQLTPLIFLIPSVISVDDVKPKVDNMACYTTIGRNISNIMEGELTNIDFTRFVGTTLILNSNDMAKILNEENVGYFNDNYDIIVKIPKTTITRKAKIRSTKVFTPKIVIE